MSQAQAWLLLVLSGLVDVAWAFAAKQADGFRNLTWSLVSIGLLLLFVLLLTKALQALPLGTAYVVWTGIGASGSVLVGALVFGEGLSVAKLLACLVILGGIAALKLLP